MSHWNFTRTCYMFPFIPFFLYQQPPFQSQICFSLRFTLIFLSLFSQLISPCDWRNTGEYLCYVIVIVFMWRWCYLPSESTWSGCVESEVYWQHTCIYKYSWDCWILHAVVIYECQDLKNTHTFKWCFNICSANIMQIACFSSLININVKCFEHKSYI